MTTTWAGHSLRTAAPRICWNIRAPSSGSMLAMDFHLEGKQVNRMEVVRHTFELFVRGDEGRLEGRPDDLLGLIAFGGYADSKVPLTLDHAALLEVARGIDVPEQLVDARGRPINEEELKTAIGDAPRAAASSSIES